MQLAYSEKYRALQDEVRAFIAKWGHLSPKPGGGRQKPSQKALDWQKLLLEQGYFARNIPTQYGGFGLPLDVLELAVIAEEIAKGNVYPGIMNQGISMLVPTLLEVGTKEQCAKWIEPTIRGEIIWCQGYSEPGSGSDLAAAKTRAEVVDAHFVINGQKIWTSFGAVADYVYLICRTSTDGPKHAGISEIVVPMDTPGVTVRPIRDLIDNRHFCEVWYEDVRVPASNLVGQEGGSFKQTMRQLEHERGGIDRLLSNRALYLDALERADASDPLVRQDIARLETGYRLGRLLVLRETLRQAPPSFSAATKTFCTEHEQRVADFVGRVAGADALVWGRTARGLCYAPGYTIMGGTSNVLRNIMGERVLGLPREPR